MQNFQEIKNIDKFLEQRGLSLNVITGGFFLKNNAVFHSKSESEQVISFSETYCVHIMNSYLFIKTVKNVEDKVKYKLFDVN